MKRNNQDRPCLLLSRRDFLRASAKGAAAILVTDSILGFDSEAAQAGTIMWTAQEEQFYKDYLILIENDRIWKHERKPGWVLVTLPMTTGAPVALNPDITKDLPLDRFIRFRDASIPSHVRSKAGRSQSSDVLLRACDARARKEMPKIIDQMQRNLEPALADWHPTPGYTLLAFCHPNGELIRYVHTIFTEKGGQIAVTVDRDTPADKLERAKIQYEKDVLAFTDFFASAVIQEMHETFKKDSRCLFIKCAMHEAPPMQEMIGEPAKYHYSEYIIRGKNQLHINPRIEKNDFSLRNFGLIVNEYGSDGKFYDRTKEFEPQIELAAQRVFKRVVAPLRNWRVIEGGGAEHFENGQWVKVPDVAGPQLQQDVQPVRESHRRFYVEGTQPLYKALVSSYYYRHERNQPPSKRQGKQNSP